MSSDVETFALPDRVELRPVVPSDNLSERILLVSCLLDVLFPRPVGLRLELDVILPYRFSQPHQLLIASPGDFFHIEVIPVR